MKGSRVWRLAELIGLGRDSPRPRLSGNAVRLPKHQGGSELCWVKCKRGDGQLLQELSEESTNRLNS